MTPFFISYKQPAHQDGVSRLTARVIPGGLLHLPTVMRYKYGMVVGTGRTLVVKVWDKPHTISVFQKSKAVWEAVGEYMGQSIRVKDRSEATAIKRWIEAARYRDN